MTDSISKEQTQAILNWLNKNREKVLDLYKDQYIAYNEKGIIAHSKHLKIVLEEAEASHQTFVIYLVPRNRYSIQILPIQFRSVVRHNWQPNYLVKFKHNQIEIKTTMLVDSGAEVSLISYKMGQDLGYQLADSESTLVAETIGGNVEYVLRNVEFTIDDHQLIAPVAWLQTPTDTEQSLLGREVIFDKFNIEFRQAEETIIFTWRES
ncbi:MAG: retropepsin-like domain-containing protein [Crocosphaera sp.]